MKITSAVGNVQIVPAGVLYVLSIIIKHTNVAGKPLFILSLLKDAYGHE